MNRAEQLYYAYLEEGIYSEDFIIEALNEGFLPEEYKQVLSESIAKHQEELQREHAIKEAIKPRKQILTPLARKQLGLVVHSSDPDGKLTMYNHDRVKIGKPDITLDQARQAFESGEL